VLRRNRAERPSGLHIAGYRLFHLNYRPLAGNAFLGKGDHAMVYSVGPDSLGADRPTFQDVERQEGILC
jgi:hypothetical protein